MSTYLNWVIENTKTAWWHDSADPAELQLGLDRGAVGVTTNPFLSSVSFSKNRAMWAKEVDAVLARNLGRRTKGRRADEDRRDERRRDVSAYS